MYESARGGHDVLVCRCDKIDDIVEYNSMRRIFLALAFLIASIVVGER